MNLSHDDSDRYTRARARDRITRSTSPDRPGLAGTARFESTRRETRWRAALLIVFSIAIACRDGEGAVAASREGPSRSATLASQSERAAGEIGGWSEAQWRQIRALSLSQLPPAPISRTNPVADDPAARSLGHSLFFDARLSANGTLHCGSCHLPERAFTDGLPKSVGLAATSRNAQTLVGVAHATWLFWDGRRDSLWSQALAPIESEQEMGLTRLEAVRLLSEDADYRRLYADLFGPLPDFSMQAGWPRRASPFGARGVKQAWHRLTPDQRDQVNRAFANLGRALEAYQRLILPGRSRFDEYVESLASAGANGGKSGLDEDELAGLRLFLDLGRTQCLQCHNGPLLTNQSFHRIGTADDGSMPDLGRFLGAQSLMLDEFNCHGRYSGLPKEECDELNFMNREALVHKRGAYKTPTLRNLDKTAPYFHDGRAATLDEVMEHYRSAPATSRGELVELALSDEESSQLVKFLLTLSGPLDLESRWLRPPARD